MLENTASMARWFAPSVDLEPNKDDTFEGVTGAMEWFDNVVSRGTIYATFRVATERPELVEWLAKNHEIGVHVHPREFGYNHDQFGELDADCQRELIVETREALADATGLGEQDIVAFRAGRHAASETTLAVLADLGFTVDASVNVNYTDYLPETLTNRPSPFRLDSGLLELPTTFGHPPLLSKLTLRAFPGRTFTATAHTLRTDKRGTDGLSVLRWLLGTAEGVSFYMHPYDATRYHSDLTNNGGRFRDRFESLLDGFDGVYLSASEVAECQGE